MRQHTGVNQMKLQREPPFRLGRELAGKALSGHIFSHPKDNYVFSYLCIFLVYRLKNKNHNRGFSRIRMAKRSIIVEVTLSGSPNYFLEDQPLGLIQKPSFVAMKWFRRKTA